MRYSCLSFCPYAVRWRCRLLPRWKIAFKKRKPHTYPLASFNSEFLHFVSSAEALNNDTVLTTASLIGGRKRSSPTWLRMSTFYIYFNHARIGTISLWHQSCRYWVHNWVGLGLNRKGIERGMAVWLKGELTAEQNNNAAYCTTAWPKACWQDLYGRRAIICPLWSTNLSSVDILGLGKRL